MRITSDLWVSALLRRIQSKGGFGAVLRRGAFEAGAIFVITRSRIGEITLYGPAPQIAYEEGKPQERRFSEILSSADEGTIKTRLDKETRFDPDLWVIEIEPTGPEGEELFPVEAP